MIMQNLIAAAKLAREASQGRRFIEIVVTETGLRVTGRTKVEEQQYGAEIEVPWSELDRASIDMASQAVELVDRRLSMREGSAS